MFYAPIQPIQTPSIIYCSIESPAITSAKVPAENMTLLNWLASPNNRNKENKEKTEVSRIKRNGPELVAAAEVKSKKMKLASTLYDHVYSTLIDMDIATLMGGMIAITEMWAKMFMPIVYFDMVKPLYRRVRDFHVATLDMPTEKL